MFAQEQLTTELRHAGMLDVPDGFSVCAQPQVIPRRVVNAIADFIRVFDRVTTRRSWQAVVTADAEPIARPPRSEVCFFSAWDFHLPPGRPDELQLIELNDNGSGMLFAAIINRTFHDVSRLSSNARVATPIALLPFAARVTEMMRREADAFFGGPLQGLVLVLDDAASLATGKFRHELVLLRDLCRHAGWPAELASPEELSWDGAHLLCRGERVSFVVNRSTDFLLEGAPLAALRAAYVDHTVFVAPNPFSYATRSDKRLLELLSRPIADAKLGILESERLSLSAHVPETRLLRAEDVDELATAREDWFYKPCHGFASHGVLPGAQVGHERLRRMLRKGIPYVAQRVAPKTRIEARDGSPLWADLRVWAYRGELLLMSGRASRNADTIDLSPPGGFMPTYASASV